MRATHPGEIREEKSLGAGPEFLRHVKRAASRQQRREGTRQLHCELMAWEPETPRRAKPEALRLVIKAACWDGKRLRIFT